MGSRQRLNTSSVLAPAVTQRVASRMRAAVARVGSDNAQSPPPPPTIRLAGMPMMASTMPAASAAAYAVMARHCMMAPTTVVPRAAVTRHSGASRNLCGAVRNSRLFTRASTSASAADCGWRKAAATLGSPAMAGCSSRSRRSSERVAAEAGGAGGGVRDNDVAAPPSAGGVCSVRSARLADATATVIALAAASAS